MRTTERASAITAGIVRRWLAFLRTRMVSRLGADDTCGSGGLTMVCRTRAQSIVQLTCAMLLTGLALFEFAEPTCMAQAEIQVPGGENFKEMHITDGERMVWLQGKPKSLDGHVELRLIAVSEDSENVMVRADRIDFFYAGDPEELDRVVASGNVSFTMETSARQLQADEVTWFTAENRAEFRGNPRVTDERGTFTGDLIVYHVSDDLIVVTRPRAVFLIPEKEAEEKEPSQKNEGAE